MPLKDISYLELWWPLVQEEMWFKEKVYARRTKTNHKSVFFSLLIIDFVMFSENILTICMISFLSILC